MVGATAIMKDMPMNCNEDIKRQKENMSNGERSICAQSCGNSTADIDSLIDRLAED